MSLGTPRNQSRDANDHMGYLTDWVADKKRSGHFTLWDHDELLSQAYLTAQDLLNRNYDPNKGAVITYLDNFLWGRVFYAYGKYHGWRYTKGKWVDPEVDFECFGSMGHQSPDKVEFPSDLTDREIDVILMRMTGATYRKIAAAFGYKSPTTVTYWFKHHIRPKFRRAM